MLIRFDSLNRFETPNMTLCNPGCVYKDGLLTNVVGGLCNTEAEEIVFNFNTTSELNFRINRLSSSTDKNKSEEDAEALRIYKAVQNRRLIFVEDVGFFMITNVKDGFSEGVSYKDISASSIDVEIQQKLIPFIKDGTYRFSTDFTGQHEGILEKIVETLPLWTIGHVDEEVANKFRTFEDVDVSLNCLGFLLENVQDAYECIILFDCVNRIINVYDQNNYVQRTHIHITKDDLINTLDISEDSEDLYTAINVLGGENITIGAINPLGTNVIYNFDYYLSWMTEPLRNKVIAWSKEFKSKEKEYYDISLKYYEKLAEAADLQMEKEKYDAQIKIYERCRENIVAESSTDIVREYNKVLEQNGGTLIDIKPEIQETLAEIDRLIAECVGLQENVILRLEAAETVLDGYKAQLRTIQEHLSITHYFTQSEYEELSHYIFEGDYRDEYITITDIMTYKEKFEQMKILYDRAMNQLLKVSQPTQEFSLDVESFIFEKEFKEWSEQLETGRLLNIELDDDDVALLFLSSFVVNYDDHTLSMTFGNRFNKFDPKSLFNDMLGNITKSANSLNFVKDVLYPIKNGELNQMQEAIQASRDLTMNSALASENEDVIIDGSGYTGRKKLDNGKYDPRQVKIIGKNIVFTDDAWQSCKVAIGEILLGDGNSVYGVNAEVLIGDLIVGNKLKILDNNGNDMFVVMDDKITASVGNVNDRLTKFEQTNKDITIRVQALEDDKSIPSEVRTSMGYTFNDKGLKIQREGEEIENLVDNTGMYVSRDGERLLSVNNEGVNAINLTARQYLMIGKNSRFEDYSTPEDKNRTACFYIGE